MDNEKIIVGITLGDPNGIGPEVVLKTLADNEMLDLCTPVVYGSSKVLAYHRKAINMAPISYRVARQAGEIDPDTVNLVNVVETETKIEMGKPGKQAGDLARRCLEAATADLTHDVIDVMVTAPINKDNIQSDLFRFAGHTDYLEAVAGNDAKALMILCHERLRVALVTTHLPLAQVPAAITVDTVVEKLRAFNLSLKRDFAVTAPRIAVLSLNPHCGENGLLGSEESEVIIPAINRAAEEDKILCFGPYAADGFFGSKLHERFDGVLAMYHDQGLAPFKTLAMDEGVNFTAGLPFVRTSPDHGTGYDIAGQGLANPASMRHAIFTAIDIVRNREAYDEAHANPLGKLYHDRGRDNVVLDLTKDE